MSEVPLGAAGVRGQTDLARWRHVPVGCTGVPRSLQPSLPLGPYRGTSLIRNRNPPLGPP